MSHRGMTGLCQQRARDWGKWWLSAAIREVRQKCSYRPCLALKSINVILLLEPRAVQAAQTFGHGSDQSRISITVIKGDTDKKPLVYGATTAVLWLQPAPIQSSSIKITEVVLG